MNIHAKHKYLEYSQYWILPDQVSGLKYDTLVLEQLDATEYMLMAIQVKCCGEYLSDSMNHTITQSHLLLYLIATNP